MKIPVEWLKDYIDTAACSKELAEYFTLIGLLLDKPIIEYVNEGFKTDVLDLEHRMDRADWLSVLGCARDIACYLKVTLKYPEKSKMPKQATDEEQVKITIDCPELVNRFTTFVIKNIEVKPSPKWLSNRLEAYGIPSINNIVDITNFVMVEYGQPMHAQDLHKMRSREIYIRRASNGEKLTTFLKETLALDKESFVLTQSGIPTVLGGIVGGIDTGVDENTKEIVLDAGNYDHVNIRKTSRRLKIQNETVLRYDKLLSPELTMEALLRAAQLIKELAGGVVLFNNDYISPNRMPNKTMKLRKQRLDLLAGTSIDFSESVEILKRLEYEILEQDSNTVTVKAPHFRTDIDVEDDLVADILRIRGYNKITPKPISGPVPEEITPKIAKFEQELRDILVVCGLNEYITSPFVEKNSSISNQIILDSAVNKDQNALRTSLKQTLEPVLNVYRNNMLDIRGIFEIGKVYFYENTDYKEERIIQVMLLDKGDPIATGKVTSQTLTTIMHKLGVDYQIKNKNIESSNVQIGKIEYDSFYLYTQELIKCNRKNKVVKEKVENYRYRDITIKLSLESTFGDVAAFIQNNHPEVISLEVLSQYLDSDEGLRIIGIRVTFSDAVFDVNKAVNDILKELKTSMNIDNKNLVI